MKTKRIVAVVVVLALLAIATAAAAAETTITVNVKNAVGMPLTGASVVAKSGTLAATPCTTAAGKCVLKKVITGKTWTVVAKDQNGKTAAWSGAVSGAKTITIQIK
jgi:hypothetical protein